MKPIVTICATLFALTNLFGQPGPDTLWTRTYGWAGNDTAFSLQQTHDGGFIVGGTGTIPGPPTQTDGFLIKTDGAGQMEAWRSYGGPGNDGIYSVIQLPDNGYVAAGYFTVGGTVGGSCFRTSALGDTLWTFSDTSKGPFTDVAVLGGDTLLFPSLSNEYLPSLTEVVCLEILTTGHPLWYLLFFGGLPQTSVNFVCPVNHTVAIGGRGATTGNPTWRLWMGMWGNWLEWYGGDLYDDEPYACAEAPDGFILAGRSSNGVLEGTLLCKINFEGNAVWLLRNMGLYSGTARAIIPAMGGGYVIAGKCPTPTNGTDMYLAKINEDGAIIWDRSYGGPGDEQAFDVVQTPDGGFVLVGMTDSWGSGGTDWYIVKTEPDPQLASEQVSMVLPQEYRITAFPNPFNPVTMLSFTLPQTERVDLAVYDEMGRQVQTLTDRIYSAGEHRIAFDGSALPSGIYFARLRSNAFTATQKLLLLK